MIDQFVFRFPSKWIRSGILMIAIIFLGIGQSSAQLLTKKPCGRFKGEKLEKFAGLMHKIDQLVRYFNLHSAEFQSFADSYRENILTHKGVNGKPSEINFPNEGDNEFEQALKSLDSSFHSEPAYASPVLDSANRHVVRSLRELQPLYDTAFSYYRRLRRHELDDFKFGKELHPKLVKAFAAFDQATYELELAFEPKQIFISENIVEYVECLEGKSLKYYVVKTFRYGEDLAITAGMQHITARALAKRLKRFQKQEEELDHFIRNKDADPKNEVRLLFPTFRAVEYSCTGLLNQLKMFEAQGVKKSDLAAQHNNMDRAYNNMIHQINASRFAKY